MAFSWSEQVVPAGTALIPVDIEYLDKSYIYLYLDGVLVPSSAYTWNSAQVIQLNAATTASTKVLLVRRTDKEFLYIMFAEGAAFIKENIDTQNRQFLHLAQELVEGRSIEGFYGDLSMNRYRITNLGDGVDSGDAVNLGQLNSVGARVTALEDSFMGVTTVSYPWYSITTETTDTLVPGYTFDKASLYIGGVCQIPDYSYIVVSNTILLADPIPPGTIVFARLGEDTDSGTDLATASALAAVQADLQSKINLLNSETADLTTSLSGKASSGANSDITSLSGLTTPLSLTQGGLGDGTASGGRANLGLSTLALGGTAARGTADTAAFAADTTLTFSASYNQAEHTTAAAWIKRIAQRVLFLENALRNNNIQKV